MRGLIVTVLTATVFIPVVGIVIFVGLEVVGPFFVEMGDSATVAGTSANDAVDMGPALALTALSILALPSYVALRLFFSGRGRGQRRTAVRRRRRP